MFFLAMVLKISACHPTSLVRWMLPVEAEFCDYGALLRRKESHSPR